MKSYRTLWGCATLAGLSTLATSALADSEEYGAQLHLESSEVGPGTASTLRVRSPLTNHGVLLFFGNSTVGIPLGGAFPVLRVGPPLSTAIVSTGSNGLVELPFTFPVSIPAGLSFFTQGFIATTDGRIIDSNLLPLTPNGSVATWSDGSSQLDSVVDEQLGNDVDFADLDKDGDMDVVSVGSGTDARPFFLINDGTGNYTEESFTRIPVAAQIPCSIVEIGDVDNDGWEDIFLGGAYDTASPAPNLLLLNDGTGHFTLDAAFPVGSGRPLDAEWADVDGDEDLDLVLLNLEEVDFVESVAGAEIFTNTAGVFTSTAQFSVVPPADPHTGGGGVSLGDFENDGDLDIFIARADASLGWQNELWLNAGNGTFSDSTATSLPSLQDNNHDTSVFDADGDGLLDLFVYNSIAAVSTANHLLLNKGGNPPVFESGNTNLPASFGNVTNIRFSGDAEDVDQDGDIDVLVGIHALPFGPFPSTDGEAVLLLNQGGVQGGTQGEYLVDTGFLFGPAYIDGDPSFEDVDGDGDFDLYLGNAGDLFEFLPPVDRLFINEL